MRRKSRTDEYVSLAIRVSKLDVAVGASINVHLRTTVPYSWDDSDPVIAPEFRLVIAGISTYPENRANDSYEITVYGERLARERRTFEQIRVRDKYNVPAYRKYRGQDYPVFTVPPGIATVERCRGTREWRAALFVEAISPAKCWPFLAWVAKSMPQSTSERSIVSAGFVAFRSR
jgi:hypothetical protein